MKYILDAIAFIIGFLMKKKAMRIATLPLKIAIYSFIGFAISLYISAFILFANFLLSLVNNLYDLIDKANSAGVGSGSAYGITLSSIWNAFIGFLSASGIGDAFYISINLFLSMLFTYFAVKLSLMVAEVFKETSKLLADSGVIFSS